jgi:omega-6 fatty acid desaturase (delta-12 desaturase)
MPVSQMAPQDIPVARALLADEPAAGPILGPILGARARPSRAELHRRLAPYARAVSVKGYLSFAIDIALYALGIAAVLFFPGLAGKIAGGILAGSGLVNLGSLSHEAAHRAVVKSRWGNKIIAVVSMTLVMFNYRLWIYDHHVLHHARTNVKHNNFLSPLTLAEYRAMSRFRRAIYRAYHSESGAGILLYYMLERWPSVHFYPGAWLPQRFRASAWRYAALQAAYAVSLLGVLVMVSSARHDSVVAAVVLGFVLPYVAWFTVFSMTAFLQHTNPRLRWYRDPGSVASPPDALSVHVRVPAWLNHMTHYVLEHPVHHISAMIPHYHLKQAQAALAGIVDPPIIAMPFTIGNMQESLRCCKLYDYDEHVWVNFNGEVTAVPVETVRFRAARVAGQPSDGLPPYGAEGQVSAGVFFTADQGADLAPLPNAPAREEARG